MKKFTDLITLQANHKQQAMFLMLVISMLYFFNFYVNDIWTPNESFYAESVREMFESGNFLDIKYNYEPRYNKPPLTYWLIAVSSYIFGLNEFGIRLPIVLLTIGSVWLTYLLGKRLYGEKGGIYSLMIMAVSVQLMAVKQYASPEIPLTFFFTLTLYWFIKAYQAHNTKYYYLSYIALGLTVLTKGYPYIVVIGGIIGLFIFIDSNFNIKASLKKASQIKLHFGIPIVLIIGMSWVAYMYLTYGQDFWEIFQRETFDRAFTRNEKSLRPFFYIEVISWTILPYSLAFFVVLAHYISSPKKIKSEIAFPFAWFIVMFLIFTAAKGKIPTYFIQAHPAMALIITAVLVNVAPKKTVLLKGLKVAFYLPAVITLIITFFTTYFLGMPPTWYLIPVLFTVITIIISKTKGVKSIDNQISIPFFSILGVYILVAAYLKPIEKYRPYNEIGEVINERENIDSSIPILIEKTLIHNIPFYAERPAIRDQTFEQINANQGKTLALVRAKSLGNISGFETLWTGMIYDFPSESQFAKFIKACIDAENGDYSKFAEYHLIYKD
tara:strand:+ start:1631 stop:3292 length:1662 start_codon:yes stop_codon:yes gene_type:complete